MAARRVDADVLLVFHPLPVERKESELGSLRVEHVSGWHVYRRERLRFKPSFNVAWLLFIILCVNILFEEETKGPRASTSAVG